ncbi:acetyl-CoA C-acyltransferase [Oceanospirillaceae bacterium]|jgi:acetyl-CoA C-acetyltransferase|uniref:acetyl-CoA C-acyltransferase n=1 Tax=Candidatus Njordibacter sp. Uisw_002 TaxID=3230971 RepID=UPI002333F7B2|nr:acetyl-CoA C-acyltransferase [Oceanospirillaceae bacterium]|tara:strand:+ start:3527 stop:4705 length:1179 start_codon:yes stop_codon:yes gene_type:complete
MSQDVYILGGSRTPMGGLDGSLAPQTASQLGSVAIKGALIRANIAPEQINEVYMGCVLAAGQGQAPARQAALGAGLPKNTPCTTVNKMCGSGMQTTIMGFNAIKAGSADIMVCGGMESMTNAPYLLPKVRQGLRMGHGQMLDHMFLDGLEDAYEGGLMGSFAQKTADDFGLTREAMDDFAIHSLSKANAAIKSGLLESEIEAVVITNRKGTTTVAVDEQPGQARIDKIPQLRAAFKKDGTITAANASSISDGASALVLASADFVNQNNVNPMARILGVQSFAREPSEFTIAPIGAIEGLLKKLDWQPEDVDLFEINEAFAMVTMLATQELGLDASKVNIYGGACAQGHPIGSTGSRIIVTLMTALKNKGLKRGIAALCIGGGEATAVAIELV